MTEPQSDVPSRRPVTLTDVARRAGVSQPTASRVLNGSDRKVAESYRRRVLDAARLGVYPSAVAASSTRRVDGFVEGFDGEATVAYPDFSWEAARSYIVGLPDDELSRIELVFAITDDMALGAIAGLRDRGRRIPQDVAVAGFDDITTLRDVVPPLTTVHVPLDQVAEETIRRALSVDGGGRTVPARPVIRASTPALRR